VLREALLRNERVLIEGTQGFGLSVTHTDYWPKCTSRDTTAAGFLSECGISPLDVDDVLLVIRCHPIRVAGDSGPLPNETDWLTIAREADSPNDITELTSVTRRVRRVAYFDAGVVRRAIAVNAPTRIALNHIDYVDWNCRSGLTAEAVQFIERIEEQIGQRIDFVGTGPAHVEEYRSSRAKAA
jgi:adenylosuccinate synthase